jgi:putative tricarboxylic transport membrane protein
MFGVVGPVLGKLGFEGAPLLLGFVLGELMEENLRRAMVLSRGDPWVFVTHPWSAMLLLLALTVLVLTILPAVRREREEVFTE